MLLLAFWSAPDLGEFSCSCLLPKPDIPQAFDLFEAKSHFFSSIQVVKQQSNPRLSCWSLLCLTLTWKDVVREHWVWWNWTLDFQNFQTDGGRSFKFFKKNCAEPFRYFCQLGCTPCRSVEAQNTSDTLQKNRRVMTHEFFFNSELFHMDKKKLVRSKVLEPSNVGHWWSRRTKPIIWIKHIEFYLL